MTAEMVRWPERKMGGVKVEREGASQEWKEWRKERIEGRRGDRVNKRGSREGDEMVK